MRDSADTAAKAEIIATETNALPPLPATAQNILACFGDEFIDGALVAAVVQGDPGICAKLLGLANSAYFGLSEPVNDIREAITRVLGVDTVRSLVLAMAIQQSFDTGKCPAFDVRRYWMQSLSTAECCKKLVAEDRLASDASRELAYTAGLCHNLGLMALAFMQPTITQSVLQAHQNHWQSGGLRDLFIAELQTDHKMMTAELARAWSLPTLMVTAYQHRARPDADSGDRLGLIVVSAAAAVGNTEVEDDQRIDLSQYASEFDLSPNDLQQMAMFGEQQKDRVRSLVGNISG